jgi:hypothetical protein
MSYVVLGKFHITFTTLRWLQLALYTCNNIFIPIYYHCCINNMRVEDSNDYDTKLVGVLTTVL